MKVWCLRQWNGIPESLSVTIAICFSTDLILIQWPDERPREQQWPNLWSWNRSKAALDVRATPSWGEMVEFFSGSKVMPKEPWASHKHRRCTMGSRTGILTKAKQCIDCHFKSADCFWLGIFVCWFVLFCWGGFSLFFIFYFFLNKDQDCLLHLPFLLILCDG